MDNGQRNYIMTNFHERIQMPIKLINGITLFAGVKVRFCADNKPKTFTMQKAVTDIQWLGLTSI